jgi:hypothetical protein
MNIICILLFYIILSTTTDPYDTDKMAVEFLQQYIEHAFAIGQCVCDKKN